MNSDGTDVAGQILFFRKPPTMQKRSRTGSPLSIESGGSFVEERGRTFVVKQGHGHEVDGASGYCPSDEPDMAGMAEFVNRNFDRKERQIKRDMRDEFESRLARDKREQEETLRALKNELTNLSKLTSECENLKEMQRSLKKELSDQGDMVLSLKRENHGLKSSSNPNSETLTSENRKLKQENEALKRQNLKLEHHIEQLNNVITDKEREVERMKSMIDMQYKKLKLDLTNTRDKFHTDQETLHADVRRQQVMLTEISQAVKTMSKSGGESVTTTIGSGVPSKSVSRRAWPHTETLKVKSLTLDNKADTGKGDKLKPKAYPVNKGHALPSKKHMGPVSR